MRMGKRRGYRRMAGCLPDDQVIAPGGRSMSTPCPNWAGVDGFSPDFCTGEDIAEWMRALDDVEFEVARLGATSATDDARIEAFRGKLQAFRELEVLGLTCEERQDTPWLFDDHTECVRLAAEAVEAGRCVLEFFQGSDEKWEPPPANGGGSKTPGGGALAKLSAPSGVLVFIGSALAGLIGFALIGGKR